MPALLSAATPKRGAKRTYFFFLAAFFLAGAFFLAAAFFLAGAFFLAAAFFLAGAFFLAAFFFVAFFLAAFFLATLHLLKNYPVTCEPSANRKLNGFCCHPNVSKSHLVNRDKWAEADDA